MKKNITLLAMAILTSISCNALNYFWVGGSGVWSDYSNHWATTSGGSTFQNQVPQSTDNVYFDSNSFTAMGQTVTVDQTIIQCNDMAWTGVTNNPTLAGDYSNTLRIYGSITLDQGQTTTLLTAIQNNNTPVNTLKSQLISNSPLSDTVLNNLINRPSPLPPPVLRDVLKPNSPVSELVYPHLQAKLANVPPPFADSINKYQTINLAYRTLTAIKRDIAVAENERQLILNDAINYYVNNDSIQEAITLLELETNKESKQGLVAEYIDLGNYSSALLKLNSIPLIAEEDIDFNNLYTLYINLAVQQKTLWDMDSSQVQMVRDIASVCPSSIATVNAQAVLFQVFGENIDPCPVNNLRSINENNSTQQILLNISAENIEYLGNNIPDPFNNSTQIPYFVPTGSKATLKVFDMKGELIKTCALTEGSNKLDVSLAEYGSGLYFYTLTIDEGRIVRHKKMILNK